MGMQTLFKKLKLGTIPRRIRPVLEQEGIVVMDEAMTGCMVMHHVKGPGKRYRNRKEGFVGWLVITKERVICYSYWKRQINISVHNPDIPLLYADRQDDKKLAIAFESGRFREGWEGVIEFRLKTDKAADFYNALIAIGVSPGKPA